MNESDRRTVREIREYDIIKMGLVEIFDNTFEGRDDELLHSYMHTIQIHDRRHKMLWTAVKDKETL